MENLKQLYVQQLRDIYDAEQQLITGLRKMADAATSPALKEAFRHHYQQTQNHVQRLERIFSNLNTTGSGERCKAMQGLIAEGEEIMHKNGDHTVKDAALIAAAQKVEHYEIASYGTLCAYAKELADNTNLRLLQETLEEEKRTDSKLTKIATNTINPEAETSHWGYHEQRIIALYDDLTTARAVIEELVASGFDRRQLSIVANANDERSQEYMRQLNQPDTTSPDAGPDAAEGAGFGAVVGTLTGLGVAVIPGLGGFVVAGLAGAALFSGIGAAIGAGVGGLTAGLVELGLDDETAEAYSTRLREGGTLVIAHVDEEWADRAQTIMRKHNPVHV